MSGSRTGIRGRPPFDCDLCGANPPDFFFSGFSQSSKTVFFPGGKRKERVSLKGSPADNHEVDCRSARALTPPPARANFVQIFSLTWADQLVCVASFTFGEFFHRS